MAWSRPGLNKRTWRRGVLGIGVESVWLPQFLLIGDDQDVEDIIKAVTKVMHNLGDLAGADPELAGLKAVRDRKSVV